MSYISDKVTSEKGFYVGDPCYVLTTADYNKISPNGSLIGSNEYNGYKVVANYTAYGDGTYEDNYENFYCVDSGTIGIIPYELCPKKDIKFLNEVGHFFEGNTASVEFNDGVFFIDIDSTNKIIIDTYYTPAIDRYDSDEE